MSFKPIPYTVSEELYQLLTANYDKVGKNSHIGNRSVAIAKEYLSFTHPNAQVQPGTQGGDLDLYLNGEVIYYEVKGTEENTIAFSKLRVSSQACHDGLKAGMTLIRVCNVGQKEVTLFFLKYGEDFDLKPECRWTVTPIRKKDKLSLNS